MRSYTNDTGVTPTIIRAAGRARAKLTSTIAIASLATVMAVTAVFAGGNAASAWGPTRQTFTMNQPSTYVTFDSITDNPGWGDERGFTLIKDVTDAANDGDTASGDGFTEVAEAVDGHTYMVKTFVHNNASANFNLIAKNTRLMAYLPTASGDSAMIQSMIAADNCGANLDGNQGAPCVFWDEAYLKSSDSAHTFKVQYVADSGRYYNNVKDFETEGFSLGNDVLTENGAKLGYQQMNGDLQGCFQYSGYATFLVKVTADEANFTLTKQARVNDGEWSTSVVAKPGDTVEFRIDYDNIGEVTQENVVLKDTLAKNMTVIMNQEDDSESLVADAPGLDYVDGSTYLVNANNEKPGLNVDNDAWTTKGLNIGSYAKGSNAIVTYRTTVPNEEELQCGENQFENAVIAYTEDGSKISTTKVTVNRDCPNTPAPVIPAEQTPGAPAAGVGIKTAVVSLVLFLACATVIIRVLVKKRHTNQ